MKNDKKISELLGLLRVRVWRVELVDSYEPEPVVADNKPPDSPCHIAGVEETEMRLAEKALKGKTLSHRTT